MTYYARPVAGNVGLPIASREHDNPAEVSRQESYEGQRRGTFPEQFQEVASCVRLAAP